MGGVGEPARPTHREADGALRMARWADQYTDGFLRVEGGPRPRRMAESDATAEPLLTTGTFGADVIRFPSGGVVRAHTHEGDHLLFVLRGHGVVTASGRAYPLWPGQCYLIEGEEPHAIEAGAGEPLVLLAVGNRHRPADSPDRLALVPALGGEAE